MAFPSRKSIRFNTILAYILPLQLSTIPLVTAQQSRPRPARWSSETHGFDGPWNAVEVTIGGYNNLVFFPGGTWPTTVLTEEYCSFNDLSCANDGYSPDDIFSSIGYSPDAQELTTGIKVQGTSMSMVIDSLEPNLPDLVSTIPVHPLKLVTDQLLVYPDGSKYPASAGCLSLGAPDVNQTFGNINGTMIPWYLSQNNFIPSSSFGLHIGSAIPSARVLGSLIWGGYDTDRVVSNVLTLDGSFDKITKLKDISITVIKGDSPFTTFNTTTQPNLLTSPDLSPAGLDVRIDPCSPYLSLPKQTCDEIASHLPVTYSRSLGLYLWDTTSPNTTQIITSASALTFTLQGQSNTDFLEIHVPFAHLNLTLTPPLVPESADGEALSYFPCFTGYPSGTPVLGRAFLQDVFLGQSWEDEKVWIAQAPGPNIQPQGSYVGLVRDRSSSDGELEVKKGGNDWEASWEGFWTALKLETGDGNRNETDPGRGGDGNKNGTQPATGGDEGGLSTGAKAGAGVGAAVVAFLLIGGLFWFWKKKQAQKTGANPGDRQQQYQYQQQPQQPVYLGNGGADGNGYGYNGAASPMTQTTWSPAPTQNKPFSPPPHPVEVDGQNNRGDYPGNGNYVRNSAGQFVELA